ncbi:MAG TPA: DUF2281 domain-containing protein [bacterium]|nr:DUF2281 domain-containing protein [bacterium]
MSGKDSIIKEIDRLPESYVEKVLEFIRFLRAVDCREKLGIAIASESSLEKDWLSPEEEQAWQNL